MSERVSLVWDEAYAAYDFGPQHPLQPVRVRLTVALAREYGLLDLAHASVQAPRPATRAELETVHDPAYIDAVERISRTADGPFGAYGWGIGIGDNPAFRGMHEASALVAGGSIVAADAVWEGAAEHAFNPAGGLHHAMRDRASGFCIYDDPAVAIRRLLDRGARRIAYLDVDVHHGDGPQAIFYTDPRVLTISLHESGRYLFPGTGFPQEIGEGDARGTSVNVALPPSTTDAAYRAAFEQVVPALIESFAPDVLVTQLGCDTHATDPLAHLALTTETYAWLARRMHEIAHGVCGGRWLAVGGGGYQLYTVVPRAWTIYFAEIAGATLAEELPEPWIEEARRLGAQRLPTTLHDPRIEVPDATEIERAARAAAEETASIVFPHHGLRAAR